MIMFKTKTTISSALVSLLILLRMMPRGKNRMLDNLGLGVWLVLTGSAAAYYTFTSWPAIVLQSKTITGAFTLLGTIFVALFQLMFTVPSLHFSCRKYPKDSSWNLFCQ